MIINRLSECHAENSVSPLEVYTADSQITLKRVEVEEIVFDSIWTIIFEVVDNNCVRAKIGKVCKSIVTVACLCVDDLK